MLHIELEITMAQNEKVRMVSLEIRAGVCSKRV